MNIGFDASRSFIGNKTGTENYSFQLLKNLSQIDHTNNYYVYLRPGANPGKWPVNFNFITIPYRKFWTQFGLAKQTFRDLLDILLIPAHTLPLIHKPRLKTIVTVHDLGAEYLPAAHQIKQRLYLKFMTHYQIKSATHIIAVSKTTKEDLIKTVNVSSDKISVIYEGYDKTLFKPVNGKQLDITLKKYSLVKGQYFLFVGTIQPRKNLERLIKAYASFLRGDPSKTPKLVLVGSKGWLSDDIYKLPKKLGIEEQVRFLGYVPDKKLPALYSGAQAFLFPSLFEGFGLPILEAMACGCPILTSNISSMPEVAGKAAILVNPYSVEDIAHGISELSTNYTLRAKLTKLGAAQVKKFSWEQAARETLEVLRSVTSG